MSRSSSGEKGIWAMETGGVEEKAEGKGFEGSFSSRNGNEDAGFKVFDLTVIGRPTEDSGRRPASSGTIVISILLSSDRETKEFLPFDLKTLQWEAIPDSDLPNSSAICI